MPARNLLKDNSHVLSAGNPNAMQALPWVREYPALTSGRTEEGFCLVLSKQMLEVSSLRLDARLQTPREP